MTKASPDSPTITPETRGGRRSLVVFVGGEATEQPLPHEGTIVVGRGRDCQIQIDHESVSRKHLALTLGDSIMAEHLGSASPSKIDGKVLERGAPVAVEPGALIEIGQARLIVRREQGESPMRRVYKLVDVVAPGSISVILTGETGVGKEVLAEAIHRKSPRAEGPFLRLNCAALPEALLESELFGYERGAFTGAHQSKPGLLEAAHAGTVFLDEIGEMPSATQAKLLRVLETREITRVGSLKPRVIDVRFIAATNRDLPALVEAGKFREDLYFRLNGITITIPPLRERLDEVRDLVRVFTTLPVTPSAMLLLESYRWPGNIRELKNSLERGALLAQRGPIDLSHLLLGEPSPVAPPPPVSASAVTVPPPPSFPTPPESLTPSAPPASSSERDRILEALEKCGGNQKEAAKLLGMTRRMLMYRMDRMGLPRPRKSSKASGDKEEE
jgi:transcriptional regulator with PAS, ATPase and Fis domain